MLGQFLSFSSIEKNVYTWASFSIDVLTTTYFEAQKDRNKKRPTKMYATPTKATCT